MNVYFDTEDNSKKIFVGAGSKRDKDCKIMIEGMSLEEVKKQRKVLLICAVAENGEVFTTNGHQSKTNGHQSKQKKWRNPGDIFLDWLLELHGASGEALRVYALNLQYDLGNVFWGKLDGYDPEFVGGRLLQASWAPGISFHDVGNLWKTSVKKMGEAVGLEKLDHELTRMEDMNGHELKKLEEYCLRDCEIIKRGHERILAMAKEYGVTKVGNTMGGLTVKMWKAGGGSIWHCADEWYLGGYYGGRTEMFREGTSKAFRKIDVASMYPSVMLGDFPDEASYVKVGDMREFGMSDVTVDIPEMFVCPLPVRTAGANAYPFGKIRGKWTNHEIRLAEQLGVKMIEMHESYGTDESCQPFKDYILRMYNDRKKAKTECEKTVLKLFMNSLYGQLAQRGDNLTMGISIHSVKFQEMFENWQEEDGDSMLWQRYGDHILIPKKTPVPEHSNYLIAAYITSYARIKLLKALLKIPRESLLYCDTDAIMYEGEQPIVPEGKGEIGEWELQESGRGEIKFYQPKSYSMDWSGFDAKKGLGEYKKFYAKGVNKEHAEEYLFKGKTVVTIPYRLKEAIRAYGSEIIDDGRPLSVWYEKLMELKGGLTANAQYQRVKDYNGGVWKPKNFSDLETGRG